MATKKSTAKPSRGRKHARDRATTPMERLKATVRCIEDVARTAPRSVSLIGNTPDETILSCSRVIHWLAHIARPGGGDDVYVPAAVLHMIDGALRHAKGETQSLWEAAKGMAEVSHG